MANSGQFTTESRKGLAGRGKAMKTKIMEAAKRAGIAGAHPNISNEEREILMFSELLKRGFDQDDKASSTCLDIVFSRGWAKLKPEMECVSFEFDASLKPHEQAAQVLTAMSNGELAPDVGALYINSIKAMIDIEEHTDLKERIEKLEAMLSGQGSN